MLNPAAQAPVRPRAAAAELDVPAQSITRATADLAAAGLARRVADEQDGRSYVLALTRRGHGRPRPASLHDDPRPSVGPHFWRTP